MTEPNRVRVSEHPAQDAAISDYRYYADDMLAEAMDLDLAGFTHWAAEVRRFAAIADAAAANERRNDKPAGLP